MTDSEDSEMYFLEYSLKQGFWHIDTMKSLLATNLDAFMRGGQVEYTPIFVGTERECSAMAEKLDSRLAAMRGKRERPTNIMGRS